MDPRVVITGIGLVTALGQDVTTFWERLLSGASGITEIESFDTARFRGRRGGEVKSFRPLAGSESRSFGRASEFALAAAAGALEDGGIECGRDLGDRWGVCLGTTSGESQEVEHYDDRELAGDDDPAVAARLFSRYPCHVLAANVAGWFGISGDVSVVPAACAAGNYAIAHAVDALRAGRLDWVLAGGTDCFSRITFSGFSRLGAVAPELCQPFDLNRRGMIPAEGAAVLLLERQERACSRRARM